MIKFEYKIFEMTALTIRKKLISYMQFADEKKVKAIYALLEEDIEQTSRVNVDQYNKELAEAEAEFVSGDYISNASMKKKINQW